MKSRRLLFRNALIVVATACCMIGCNGSSGFRDGLNEAAMSIEAGDYENAQSICDNLYKKRSSAVRASELGRLSLLFMELSNSNEQYSQSDNIAAATHCYLSAFELNPDSAMAFYTSISGTPDADRFIALNWIVKSLTGERPVNVEDQEAEEQLPADTIEIK